MVEILTTVTAPSKHEKLNQWLYIVGPASQTVDQHEISIGSMSRVCCWLTVFQQHIQPDLTYFNHHEINKKRYVHII